VMSLIVVAPFVVFGFIAWRKNPSGKLPRWLRVSALL
jgi:hypothetical protein